VNRIWLWIVDSIARIGTRLMFRMDAKHLDRMPKEGPFILISNHVSELEFLPLRKLLGTRGVHTLAKAESWEKPVLGKILDLWNAIPIRRGESDMTALRTALQVLKDGKILGIMPEGTRSHDGSLGRGNPGIAMIALKSGCPIVPMAFWGIEDTKQNLRKLRRTDFHFRVGELFHLEKPEGKSSREDRQRMADQIMRHVAELLPESYRGVYGSSELPGVSE